MSGRRPAPPPRPRGPKPIIGWKPEDEEGGEGGEGERGTSAGAVAGRAAAPGVVRQAMRRRLPPPGRRRGPRVPGPTGPEDAWMWEGVPAGEDLIGTPVPGKDALVHGAGRTRPADQVAPQGLAARDRSRRRRVSRESGSALPLRSTGTGRRDRRLEGGTDRHRGHRTPPRRSGAALAARRGGRGRGDRHPRALRRAGHRAGGGPNRGRVVAGHGVLGGSPSGLAGPAASGHIPRACVCSRPAGTAWG